MQKDLKQATERLEIDLQNTSDNDRNISIRTLDEYKKKKENILQKENYLLPPKLPPIGTFLAKYTDR